MKLYVANCTKTNAVLNYRIPEIKNAISQNVDSGQQILVAKPDLNMPQIEAFLDQMTAYGLVLVEELPNLPKDKIIYWLACSEKPMKIQVIEQAFLHNALALKDLGISYRKAAAIATNNKIQEYAPHAAGTLEITIQEESETNTSKSTGEELVHEGYRIDRGDPFLNAVR